MKFYKVALNISGIERIRYYRAIGLNELKSDLNRKNVPGLKSILGIKEISRAEYKEYLESVRRENEEMKREFTELFNWTPKSRI